MMIYLYPNYPDFVMKKSAPGVISKCSPKGGIRIRPGPFMKDRRKVDYALSRICQYR